MEKDSVINVYKTRCLTDQRQRSCAMRHTSTPDEVISIGVVDPVPATVLKDSESYVVNQHQMRLLTKHATSHYIT